MNKSSLVSLLYKASGNKTATAVNNAATTSFSTTKSIGRTFGLSRRSYLSLAVNRSSTVGVGIVQLKSNLGHIQPIRLFYNVDCITSGTNCTSSALSGAAATATSLFNWPLTIKCSRFHTTAEALKKKDNSKGTASSSSKSSDEDEDIVIDNEDVTIHEGDINSEPVDSK